MYCTYVCEITMLYCRFSLCEGLSRTCEIFGVTELVIGNKNILEDALFQALSVTSERWLNITEVGIMYILPHFAPTVGERLGL